MYVHLRSRPYVYVVHLLNIHIYYILCVYIQSKHLYIHYCDQVSATKVSLVELLLDDNCITEVPDEVATLKKLRYISLRNNRISKGARQTISPALFVETAVVNIGT